MRCPDPAKPKIDDILDSYEDDEDEDQHKDRGCGRE